MPSILVVTYDTTTGRYLVQKAGSAQIADGAITSGLLASGIVGTVHLRDLNVTSAKLAAALISSIEAGVADEAVTSAKLASGAVGTVHMWPGAVTSSIIASGNIGWPHIGSQAIRSGHLGSGQIASGHLVSAIAGLIGTVADHGITSAKLASGAVIGDRIADAGIFSGKIASGAIGPSTLLANAIIVSGKIASGIIGWPHIGSQAILSGQLASGIIAGVHIKDGSILSGELGSGIIGDTLLKDFGLLSGKYASGSITEQALVSGISIDISEVSQEPSYRAGTLISAYLGVQFSTSGYFSHAQAADVDTIPAVGLAIDNIASGDIGTFQYQGRITNPGWDFSGHIGKLLFLGTSSQVTPTAPSASGQGAQRLGKVIGPTIAFLRPDMHFVQVAE